MALVHSLGPSCALYEGFNEFTRRASEISDKAPKIRAHYFYCNGLPIDDPLSPVPAPSTSYQLGTSKLHPPRPFSAYDNAALEEAWQGLQGNDYQDHNRKQHGHGLFCTDTEIKHPRPGLDGVDLTASSSKHGKDTESKVHRHGLHCHDKAGKSLGEGNPLTQEGQHPPPVAGESSNAPDEINIDNVADIVKRAKDSGSPGVMAGMEANKSVVGKLAADNTSPSIVLQVGFTRTQSQSHSHLLLCDDPQHGPIDETTTLTADELAVGENEGESSSPGKKHRNIFRRKTSPKDDKDQAPSKLSRTFSPHKAKAASVTYGSSPSERHTTGTPFLRAPSPNRPGMSAQTDGVDAASEDEGSRLVAPKPPMRRYRSDNSDSRKSDSDSAHRSRPRDGPRGLPFKRKERKAYVPVGLSRLHLVEMPALEMKPIYWSPVHDISSVVRGTWFYKETMLPVESDVANQLEEGYEYMKPWSATYGDEVSSCLEIGPEAELKIVHKLWPTEAPQDNNNASVIGKGKKATRRSKPEPLTPEEKARKHAAKLAASTENQAVGTLSDKQNQETEQPVRLYGRSSVIYANAKDAQILRPNMLPSAARGRRPLGPIRKGRIVGIPVVRGFDYKAWYKLYPEKKNITVKKARAGATAAQSGAAATIPERDACPACVGAEERPKVTDLVLVIHGIGQKLSERIESYHFTHAINSFRRQLNVEYETEAIQPWLRPTLGGIMVLPVNWRSTLSFEDGGPDPNFAHDEDPSKPREFTLKDITAETIPAVRNLISDVMLDIPYYLSHHKPKMIEAVIKEANRIYRLWCRNNPGFQESGRVHLIAHSLGSVMALDILSKQPTRIPKQLDLTGKKVHGNMFEFDTKNLFFCGSPAGFFLLLNRAPLIPRNGRAKPESNGEDHNPEVTGKVGTYGCLAVDNIYNILHYNDPIAYRVNACVDVDYASSLQPASVPSASATWLQSIGYVFRGKPGAGAHGMANVDTLPERPQVGKQASTIEMETHNFTLEEIAEKKMFLLNDNGQIDYFLSSGGGPLEIQYLNMLSAHSSYWTLQDFVRFLVVEIGRKPGRSETLLGMRAVKKVRGKK